MLGDAMEHIIRGGARSCARALALAAARRGDLARLDISRQNELRLRLGWRAFTRGAAPISARSHRTNSVRLGKTW
jgi:hypothetical protein